jgi:hypothetical protein
MHDVNEDIVARLGSFLSQPEGSKEYPLIYCMDALFEAREFLNVDYMNPKTFFEEVLRLHQGHGSKDGDPIPEWDLNSLVRNIKRTICNLAWLDQPEYAEIKPDTATVERSKRLLRCALKIIKSCLIGEAIVIYSDGKDKISCSHADHSEATSEASSSTWSQMRSKLSNFTGKIRRLAGRAAVEHNINPSLTAAFIVYTTASPSRKKSLEASLKSLSTHQSIDASTRRDDRYTSDQGNVPGAPSRVLSRRR